MLYLTWPLPGYFCSTDYLEIFNIVTCITIEQYSRNVTSRLLGLVVIRSVDVSFDASVEESEVIDVPEGG